MGCRLIKSASGRLEEHHKGAVPISVVAGGERRLEARTYLTDGFGLRQRIEALSDAWVRFEDIASVWQPSRLKGYVVAEGRGLPFLSAGQAFESRPRVRKWLAKPMIPDWETRLVSPSTILLSCSGEVGRVSAVYPEHDGIVLTHDLLRVESLDEAEYGWLYAYMKTPVFYEIARSAQYGHMIKHLEAHHVKSMPVVLPELSARREVSRSIDLALSLRRQARSLQNRAYRAYSQAVNPSDVSLGDEVWSSVPVKEMAFGRRRLEGQFARANVRALEEMIARSASHGLVSVAAVTESVRLGSRFKRFFGDGGTPYRSASELFDVNAPVTKRIYAALLEDPSPYVLNPGEIIMACSGQTYGLLGRTVILTEAHAGVFGSHDLIRIKPNNELMRTGYLHTALSHEVYGRPRVVRHASGTSIPHLDPVDIRPLLLPRFDPRVESEIADLAEESSALSSRADALETAAVQRASTLVEDVAGVGVD